MLTTDVWERVDRVEEAELVLERDIRFPVKKVVSTKRTVRATALRKRCLHDYTQHYLNQPARTITITLLQITNTTNTFAQMPRQSHDPCLESAHELALTFAFDLPQT
jgi:hypothetical protein